MKHYLLDTNICIFLLRGMYEVDKRINDVGLENCCISEGAELGRQKGLSSRIQQLEKFLSSIHILRIGKAINLYAAEKARLRLAGTPAADDFDLLIGCTAIAYNMIMVTENLKDFRNLSGIYLENWIERL